MSVDVSMSTRMRALAAIVVLCSLAVCACGSALTRSPVKPSSPTASRDASPPKTVVSRRAVAAGRGALRPGTRVSAGFKGIRVFANRRDGFAIADLPRGGNGTYPIATTDGGKTWRTNGPVLHVPAAQAPLAVGQPGVLGTRIYFAWCGACNSVIDSTPDAGKHWWQAFMPGNVLAVLGNSDPRAGLMAVVQGPTSGARARGAPLWVYLSADGRRWSYSHRLD
jgi:hypothetical protein